MINSSGIGVYLSGILPFLLKSENYFLLLGNPNCLHSFKEYPNAEIIECNVKPFSLEELLFFPKGILKQINSSSFFYSPFFNIPGGIKVTVCTTIHDIIFPDIPELISRTGLAARMWFYRRTQRRSKRIFTVSQFSKSRIEHHLGNTKPVIVTYSAIQTTFLSDIENSRTIKKETIVFIGNIKKHKGLDLLLEAFLKAKDRGLSHKLLIIGEKDNFRSSDSNVVKKIESAPESCVTFTGYVSGEQLKKHLSEAALLVQPSLYEGFGLPPLEAMVLGTAVLISDIPVFREIYADFPVNFFRKGDVEDLENKLLELLNNTSPPSPVLSEELLSRYSFEKTANTILGELK